MTVGARRSRRSGELRPDLRAIRRLVWTELRARVRGVRDDWRRLLAWVVIGALFLVGVPALAAADVTAFGGQLGGPATPLGTVGAVVLGTVVGGLYVGASTATVQARIGTVGPLVRTSMAPRAVVLGRFGIELLGASVLLLPVPGLLVLVAVGGGGVGGAALVGMAALVPYLTGVMVGRLFASTARYLGLVARIPTWAKVVTYVLVLVVVIVGQQLLFGPGSGGSAGAVGTALLPGRPLAAYAGTVLAPLGTAVSTVGVAVAGGLVAALLLCGVGTVRVERALLTDDPGAEGPTDAAGSVGVPRLVGRWRSAAIAWRYLLRTRRDPRMLAHLSMLVVMGAIYVSSFVDAPDAALSVAPGVGIVAGGVVTGASYCLNPMGDEHDQLPLLFTSTASTAVFLRGRILAGAALGLPLAVGGTLVAGLLVDPPVVALLQTVLAVVLVAASGGIALGMGAAVPKFETREMMNVERAHPSNVGLFVFFSLVLLVGGAGFALLRWTLAGAGLARAGVLWLGYCGALAVFGGGGYAYAVNRFDDLTLDDV